MDSYDAVVEHLKKAQARGMEAVTNRLDFVLERLDELVRDVKSAVAEARPQSPDELFPVADVESALGELREQVVAAAAPVVQAPAPAAEPALSLELLRQLDKARSQSELLRDLLTLLRDHAARAVVLVIRGTAISAWSGAGFADPERLKRWQGELGASPTFSTFSDDARPLSFAPTSDPLVTGWLGSDGAPAEAMILPVCLRGKVMGGVYIDRLAGKPWRPDVAQSLVALTCWLIDTLPYRQTVPSPMLAMASAVAGLEPAAAAPVEPELEDEFDPSATVRVEMPPSGVKPPVREPSPAETVQQRIPVAQAAPKPAPKPEPPPVQPVVPPPATPARRPAVAAGEPALSPEEQARHEEARRFARLLVSEIKLYNEEEVEKGRAGKDLYQRLKEDVDRSREMFDKRIPPEVRSRRDYFHDELVRILGDGDPDSLGM